MCGIAGIVAYRPEAPPVDLEELLTVRDAMAMRGPDGAGHWTSKDGRVGLAHRRLAVIDLSPGGAQPMVTADGRLCITFNGEIYNYRALRKDLSDKGYRFQSTSDTEVLLALFRDRGPDMVHALRGMYALAIWDEETQSLFLARDPFGIKPLYFADDGKTVRFASQVKALLKFRGIDASPSAAGHVGFYLWGHVPEPHTLFRGIAPLPAGCTMVVNRSGCARPKAFFSIAEEFAEAREKDSPASYSDAIALVHEALRESLQHHLVSDVPVGVFLSSGLDSTTITALAAEAGHVSQLHTITLGFNEYRGTPNDEVPMAELVAACYGTSHQTTWVSSTDFEASLQKMLAAMDQPSIDGVNTYFVSRAAAASGMKVALSGVGGDELFAGYPSFKDLPRIVALFGIGSSFPRASRAFRMMSAPLLNRLTSPKLAGMFEYGGTYAGAYLLRRGMFMPWELPLVLDPDLVREGWRNLQTLLRLEETIRGIESPTMKVAALELCWYMRNQLLRDSDWAGMAHSVEIRVPFVDIPLFRAVARVLGKHGIVKTAVARAPVHPLPRPLLEKRKTGFSIPVREWLRPSRFAKPRQRGLRAWAQLLNPPLPRKTRVLTLATDAFGGHGGIAKFNRDLLNAMCSHDGCKEVVAIPRVMNAEPGPLPPKLTYLTGALNSKSKFISTIMTVLFNRDRFDIVICGHIHLLPIAWLASVLAGARLVLIIHGIDAWRPTRNMVTNMLVKHIDAFISVSGLTKERFTEWSGVDADKGVVLPNSIDLSRFRPSPKRANLVERYSLRGKTVLMTVGRLVSAERYKGFDEILEILPTIVRRLPDVVYMIVGEGNDRVRLESKALALGVRTHVIFTGFIPEEDKCDHYNLADAYVMPSRGEGFGIVFLEALACGVPVIGSTADGGREALKGGLLGTLVDPDDAKALTNAIFDALRKPKRVHEQLTYFSFANFEERVHRILNQTTA
jgi:asparagine synthase (glutamine-hydrolysing)